MYFTMMSLNFGSLWMSSMLNRVLQYNYFPFTILLSTTSNCYTWSSSLFYYQFSYFDYFIGCITEVLCICCWFIILRLFLILYYSILAQNFLAISNSCSMPDQSIIPLLLINFLCVVKYYLQLLNKFSMCDYLMTKQNSTGKKSLPTNAINKIKSLIIGWISSDFKDCKH